MKYGNRNLARDQWYEFWRKLRKAGRSYDWIGHPSDPLAAKQKVIDAIRKYQVDGKVRLCDRFMDCDCAQSTSWRDIPATYVHYEREVDEIYAWAEGPGTTWLESPATKPPAAEFRDLALEAFEDGHPHSVSEVRYESD